MQWGTSGDHSPDVLTLAHQTKILSTRRMYFFLRKVDERESMDLLSRLDVLKAQSDEPPGPGNISWVQGDASRGWKSNAVACPSRHVLPELTPPHESGSQRQDWYLDTSAPAPAPPAVSSLDVLAQHADIMPIS
mmetsp:Transcript_18624/g.39603  ORF Transcript_18624/g.39603 Transcript_18624/m.39603 type:complete len:134 (-) Transcript_18624:23-424(-)